MKLALLALAAVGTLTAFVSLEIDPMVQKHIDSLQKSQTVTVQFKLTEVGGGTQTETLTLSKEGFGKLDTPSMTTITNGKIVWVFNKAKKTYTQSDFTPEWQKKFLSTNEVWIWSAISNPKFAEQISSTKVGETREVKGMTVADITIGRGTKAPFTITVAGQDGTVVGAYYKSESGKDMMIAVTNLNLSSKPADPEKFAWVPPADAVLETAPAAGDVVTFDAVMPILKANCTECHSGSRPAGRLDLSSYEAVVHGGSIVPGEPGQSRMIRMIEAGKMPPRRTMAQGDIDTLKNWIRSGAKQ